MKKKKYDDERKKRKLVKRNFDGKIESKERIKIYNNKKYPNLFIIKRNPSFLLNLKKEMKTKQCIS